MTSDNDNKNNADTLATENRILSVRLNLAQAFTSMWLRAYDALLSHSINVRDLNEYKDTTLLDRGLKEGSLEEGRGSILEYIKRVESGIVAAIRRKTMRKV